MGQEESNLSRKEAFVATVWEHYRLRGRHLPWRQTRDPYEILVSEVMLQQTQVARVLDKYPQFIATFPSLAHLARASLTELLEVWSGLGYNRRALSLHRTANLILARHGGRVPSDLGELRRLPGIGPATAAAVCVFAYDRPEAFVETNIRAAFIHFFFPQDESVADTDILPLVESTMDRSDPRSWFYALMDYGVWVKKTHRNPGRKSAHHKRQGPLAGSRRQLRAQTLAALLPLAPAWAAPPAILALLPPPARDPAELTSVLEELTREGFLSREGDSYRIA